MDIRNIREVLTPEAWQTLQKHFVDLLKEVLVELEKKFHQDLPSPLPAKPSPALLNPVAVKTPLKRKLSDGGLRKLEYPPSLDLSRLAYTPGELSAMRISGMKRTHEEIAVRRDLIAKGLRMAGPTGASEEDILGHLRKVKFPVDDAYYGAVIGGRLRIHTSINNDLTFFLKRAAKTPWVRRLANGNWKWIRGS